MSDTNTNQTSPAKVLYGKYEDDEGNLFFYYTGKKSVIGLKHPDYMIKNEDNHKYARIALLKFNEIGDNEIIVYMNETLDVTTLTSTTDGSAVNKMKSFKVHVECKGQAGRVDKDSVKCTIVNSNTADYKTEKSYLPYAIVTEDQYIENEITKYGVGIWIDISDMRYILVNVDKSLSTNSAPIDVEHFPTAYSVEYLSNDNKSEDENLVNLDSIIEGKEIIRSTDTNINNSDRLDELEKKTQYAPHMFTQNTVVYDPTYTVGTARVEDVVKGTSVIGPTTDRILTLDSVKKVFRVSQEGIYALQLKNGFYLVQGESRVDLNVYIGTNQIKEMRISSYLTSNPEGQDDAGKVIKNIFSSNVYVCHLKPEDEIKLTANFMNTDNIVLENETMITVTALQYNMYDQQEEEQPDVGFDEEEVWE